MTSDGVFVWHPDYFDHDVSVGDHIRFEGEGAERFGQTQMSRIY